MIIYIVHHQNFCLQIGTKSLRSQDGFQLRLVITVDLTDKISLVARQFYVEKCQILSFKHILLAELFLAPPFFEVTLFLTPATVTNYY